MSIKLRHYAVHVLDKDKPFGFVVVSVRVLKLGRSQTFYKVAIESTRKKTDTLTTVYKEPTVAEQQVMVAQWLCHEHDIHEVNIKTLPVSHDC